MCLLFNNLRKLLGLSKPADKPHIGNRNGTLPRKKITNTMNKLTFFSSLALALAFGSQAGATTITLGGTTVAGQGVESSVAGAITTTFNGLTALPTGFVAQDTTPAIPLASGSSSNVYLAPTGDTSTYLTTGTGFILDYAIPAGSTYFGFYWGSVDLYNTFEIDQSNGSNLQITGATLASMFPSITVNGNNSYFVNVYADPGTTFTSAGFASSINSFEADNVATATPEPASIAMLAGGLLVVAGALRRRKA